MKQLILGGARSGKSHYAQTLAQQSSKAVIYIATAEAGDAEMQRRIEQHQQDRPEHWQLVEEPLELAKALLNYQQSDVCVLVDCLTLWLSNCLCQAGELDNSSPQDPAVADDRVNLPLAQSKIDELLQLLPELECEVILVSNEVGMGIMPMGALSRHFVDEAGRLHQQLAGLCDRVVLMTAGLALELKPSGQC